MLALALLLVGVAAPADVPINRFDALAALREAANIPVGSRGDAPCFADVPRGQKSANICPAAGAGIFFGAEHQPPTRLLPRAYFGVEDASRVLFRAFGLSPVVAESSGAALVKRSEFLAMIEEAKTLAAAQQQEQEAEDDAAPATLIPDELPQPLTSSAALLRQAQTALEQAILSPQQRQTRGQLLANLRQTLAQNGEATFAEALQQAIITWPFPPFIDALSAAAADQPPTAATDVSDAALQRFKREQLRAAAQQLGSATTDRHRAQLLGFIAQLRAATTAAQLFEALENAPAASAPAPQNATLGAETAQRLRAVEAAIHRWQWALPPATLNQIYALLARARAAADPLPAIQAIEQLLATSALFP